MGLFRKKQKVVNEFQAGGPKNKEPKVRDSIISVPEVVEHKTDEPQPKEESSGWEAIVHHFEKIYGTKEMEHYAVLIPWELGGKDPLRGISVYDGGDYYHFISFGLSELYEKESSNQELSGYGMEFTLKLNKHGIENVDGELRCVCRSLQTIAKYTFTDGERFLPNEYIYTGQKTGMDVGQKSKLTGFITVEDEVARSIETPNGTVTFVELIGATDAELVALQNQKITVAQLYERLKGCHTDYTRDDICIQ